jgi:hypothetical protein
MPQEHLLQVSPEIAANEMLLKEYLGKLQDCSKEIQHVAILKRSIDARQKAIKINLKVAVYLKGELLKKTPYDYPNMEMLQRRKKLLSLERTCGTVCCLAVN